ncbi:MAG: Lrp/AsnC ligand binding domain-containing protein [Polaromonas sp.]|nr:Lrp/AsnC ligand binding domain-containing protein [Polaromonas sp.]
MAILRATNGRWDLLVGLRAERLRELARVLERIRLLKSISNTKTSIHLKIFRLS